MRKIIVLDFGSIDGIWIYSTTQRSIRCKTIQQSYQGQGLR